MNAPVELDIGFSSCPNDTFIFNALVNGRIDTMPYRFRPRIADVEALNELAFAGGLAVTKLSFYAYLLLKDRYQLLDAGAALGYGCGPLLVAGNSFVSVKDARIAVPGRYTTAYLLFQLWAGPCERVEFVRFDEILPGIAAGRFDAGVIIHEGRFVYQRYNCTNIIDLGQWWEAETGLPIPLGCIALRRELLAHREALEAVIRESLFWARGNPAQGRDFIRQHAQEMDDRVIDEHISLYVNDFTLSLGSAGNGAVSVMEEQARCRKLL